MTEIRHTLASLPIVVRDYGDDVRWYAYFSQACCCQPPIEEPEVFRFVRWAVNRPVFIPDNTGDFLYERPVPPGSIAHVRRSWYALLEVIPAKSNKWAQMATEMMSQSPLSLEVHRIDNKPTKTFSYDNTLLIRTPPSCIQPITLVEFVVDTILASCAVHTRHESETHRHGGLL